VRLLFIVIANRYDGIFRRIHLARSLGGHVQLAICAGDRAHDGLPILHLQMQRLRRHNGRDRIPLHVHFASKFRLDQQDLRVGFHDRSAEAVAVLQR
jgi:hypothetical protein